jgi:Metallopeptidase toxin 3
MNKIGQLNKAKLAAALKWGHGPSVKITTLVGAIGEFTPFIGSNEIRIETKIVKDFEKGKGVRVAKAGNVFLVGVTLLHELVHWGDDQDGIDRLGEEGAEFETLVYGKVID